ncbi:hypothetical protein AVEN_144883-1 [Araneus ventricosus]|uniref:Uncharacterized protein n=1 Tax=Araneus ventricosus TaxID=182803 RepID=A0A4Y2EDX1_ARAVE|nr:hypothetical protein AVEN_144883-1 [Araneus ventricosus]
MTKIIPIYHPNNNNPNLKRGTPALLWHSEFLNDDRCISKKTPHPINHSQPRHQRIQTSTRLLSGLQNGRTGESRRLPPHHIILPCLVGVLIVITDQGPTPPEGGTY